MFIKVSYTCGAYVTYDHIMHAPHVGVLSVLYGNYLIDQFGCKKMILIGYILLILGSTIVSPFVMLSMLINTNLALKSSNYLN